MGKTSKKTNDRSTEELILEAARKVFTRRGYAAARMEEIAQEAGINRALLHYYFRSKEKMYDLIFEENLKNFYSHLFSILASEAPLTEKIRHIIHSEIDMLLGNPELPLFVVREIAQHPERMREKMKKIVGPHMLDEFSRQLQAEARKGNIRKTDPRQLLLSMLGLCIFPFIAKPIVTHIFEMDAKTYDAFMKKRRTIVADLILHSINKTEHV